MLRGTDTTVHNVCVLDRCSRYVTLPDETESLTFVAPAGGSQYYCEPHRGMGMIGTLSVAGVAPDDPARETPGITLLAGLATLAAVAILARR